MLRKKNKILSMILLGLFFIACNKYKEYNLEEINDIRNQTICTSQFIVGEKEYWKIYNQINDTINSWRRHGLKGYDEDSTLVEFQVDSILCFNGRGNKMVASRLGKKVKYGDALDGIIYYYGVKINYIWYFFSGAVMYLPREYYQEDIHIPLSFEKLKQIATDKIYRGYLKKDKKGQREINEGVFQDVISANKRMGGYGSCFECKTEEEYVLYRVRMNWASKDTTITE